MSVDATTLDQFVEKKVVLVRNLDKPNDKGETAEELEGTLVVAAGEAVMFKPKGKTNPILIDVADLESIDFAQEKAKTLSRKTLKAVHHGQARTHLLERHSYTLTEINAMSETEAFRTHEGIDHEAADLGHTHKDKSEDDSDEE